MQEGINIENRINELAHEDYIEWPIYQLSNYAIMKNNILTLKVSVSL